MALERRQNHGRMLGMGRGNEICMKMDGSAGSMGLVSGR